jgi:dTDP-4-amino-4,6-dideoxygalactose transaminase
MKVPFLDLKINYLSIKDEIDSAISEVLNRTAFALGFAVEDFEKRFADYIGVKHAVACNSGTSALHLALLAVGVKAGDEVITTPHTFVSTTWAISYVGAKPIFVDIDPMTYTIDPAEIERKITQKTKAIIPVHLYGQTADIDPILEIAKKHKLILIEDTAQSHGALYNGNPCGSMGDMGCFSFYPGKNLGAFGEGGMVTTNNDEFAEKIRLLRNHSQPQKYIHTAIGYNYRMDGIQGAVLGVKLRHLDKWNALRRKAAEKYTEGLKHIDGLTPPFVPAYSQPVWHLYELKMPNKELRDGLMDYLQNADIASGLHYPIPVHLQEPYSFLEHKKGDFPETEKAADCLISLPMFPEITDEQINYVVDKIKEFMTK